MIQLVDETEIKKMGHPVGNKTKVKGTVPNNFKWLVNQTKKLEKLKVFESEKAGSVAGNTAGSA